MKASRWNTLWGKGEAELETRENGPQLDKRNHESGENPAEPEYPRGLRLAFIFVSLFFAVLCVGLDRIIVATAIPKITTEFNSLADVGWYGSAYFLPSCSFQLMFGKLFAEFSVRWVFLVALALFEIGSVVCAAAPSSAVLIAGRAIAGVGSAGILTGGLTILGVMVPLRQRPKYLGALGASMGISQVVAPTIGGSLVDYATWRWCFWINLPVGAVTFAAILFCFRQPSQSPSDKTPQPMTLSRLLETLDVRGTVFFLPSIVCLLLALQWAGSEYAWNSWRIILLLCCFAVSFTVWVVIQFYAGDKATLPLRIARQRSIVATMWFIFSIMGMVVLVLYFVPIWFQTVQGASAYQSGINNLASTVSAAILAISAGFIVSKIGYYVPLMLASTVLISIAAGLISRFYINTTTSYWVGSLVLFGCGLGVGVQQSLVVPQAVLTGSDVPLGTAAIIFVQTLSGTVFLSVGQNVFQSRLIGELRGRVPRVDPQVVLDSGAADLAQNMAKLYPEDVQGILVAYAEALQAVFLIALVLSCLSLLGSGSCEWKNVKKGAQGHATPLQQVGDKDAEV